MGLDHKKLVLVEVKAASVAGAEQPTVFTVIPVIAGGILLIGTITVALLVHPEDAVMVTRYRPGAVTVGLGRLLWKPPGPLHKKPTLGVVELAEIATTGATQVMVAPVVANWG